jgi:hypothetical protein
VGALVSAFFFFVAGGSSPPQPPAHAPASATHKTIRDSARVTASDISVRV